MRPTAVTVAVLIETPQALLAAVAALAAHPRIALDTEGNGMHAYLTRLSVIQLAAAPADEPAEQVFVVDPFAVTDLHALATLLGPEGPEKVIHDLAFDARLLGRVGLPLGRVIDTSVHARFLGLRETGLGSLLASRLGVTISKAMQQADWGARPLGPAELAYLCDDVAHLGRLAAGLIAEAAARGISDEIAVETSYALEQANAPESPMPAYARLKGARQLDGPGRAVLREIWRVREDAAAGWNVPVGRVVANDGLLQIARSRPTSLGDLKRAARLFNKGAQLAPELLAAVQRGRAAGDVPEDEQQWFVREIIGSAEIAARKARETALGAWRQAISAARGVDLQVVLPGHALSDIVRTGPRTLDELARVPGLGRVRLERDGEALLACAAGVAPSVPAPPSAPE